LDAKRALVNSIVGCFISIASHVIISSAKNLITNTTEPSQHLDKANNLDVALVSSFIVQLASLMAFIVGAVGIFFLVLSAYKMLTESDSHQDSNDNINSLNQETLDIRILDNLKHIFPKQISDEFIGDLKEKRHQMINSGTPLWIVFVISFGWQLKLIWAYFQIKSQQKISQWITHVKQIFFI
jgi:hypothetical protein